jgi:hypothetical protein
MTVNCLAAFPTDWTVGGKFGALLRWFSLRTIRIDLKAPGCCGPRVLSLAKRAVRPFFGDADPLRSVLRRSMVMVDTPGWKLVP